MDQNQASYAAEGIGSRTLEMLESAQRHNEWLLTKLAPFLGDRNLELGAGIGTLTALVARERSVVATEPSEAGRIALVQRFAANPNLHGIVADYFQVAPDESFDTVYSSNVLEHLPDDLAAIEHAAGLLRVGGYFVALVPAGQWLYSRFDARVGHYRRYTAYDRRRLTCLLEARGVAMKLVTYRHFNLPGALGWWLFMRVAKRDELSVSSVRLANRLVPVTRVLDKLSMPIGQNLVMAFQRVG